MADALATLTSGQAVRSGPVPIDALTAADPGSLLAALEDRIRSATEAMEDDISRARDRWWREAGEALLRIRAERLWESAGFESFGEYIEARWTSVSTVYRKMEFVSVARALEPAGIQVDKESHATFLATVINRHGTDAAVKVHARAAAERGGASVTVPSMVKAAQSMGLMPSPEPLKSRAPRPTSQTWEGGHIDTETREPAVADAPVFHAAPPGAPGGPMPTLNPFQAPAAPYATPADEAPVPVVVGRLRELQQMMARARELADAVEVAGTVEHPPGSGPLAERIGRDAAYVAQIMGRLAPQV